MGAHMGGDTNGRLSSKFSAGIFYKRQHISIHPMNSEMCLCGALVVLVLLGFEPRLQDSESCVLTELDDSTWMVPLRFELRLRGSKPRVLT